MKAVGCMFAVLVVHLLVITNAQDMLSPSDSNDEPPKIIEGPSSKVVLFGSKVILKCRATGSPKPRIFWLSNGAYIPDFFGFKTLPSGDLEIKEAMFWEPKQFSCNASNVFGTAQESAWLDVKQRTRIYSYTNIQKVRVGATAKFSCNAQHDESLSVVIEWLKDGKPIDYDKQERYSKLNDNSLEIFKTIGPDSAEYTCVARTVVDEDRSNITLVVQDVPNPPLIENVICDGLSAKINWKSQGDNRSPLDSFVVLYNTSFAPEKWEIGDDRVRSDRRSYTYFMNPGASYSFRIIAENHEGASPPSEHSKTCTNQPDVPNKNPKNVKTESTDPTNLVITWSPMPEIEHSAPKFHYRVFWKRDIPGSIWESRDVFDWQENKIIVSDQPTFKKFLVKVVAVNEKGESKIPPKVVIGYSGEDRPLLAPANFKLVKLQSSTSALLKWDPVSPESLRGIFKGYKLQTWTADEGEELLREVQINNNDNEFLLTQLKPYSKNFVRICAYNSLFDGPTSVISFDTPEGVPSAVEDLEAHAISPSAVLLAWDKPLEPNGRLTGYRIYYEEVGGRYVGERLESHSSLSDPSVTSAKLAYLKPDTKYRITVVAKTAMGEGEEYFIERKTLRPDRRPEEPSEPNFKWEPLTNIKVTWQPFNGYPTGTHFFTQYRVKGETKWHDTPKQEDEVFQIVGELRRDTEYEFRVVSVDGNYKKESEIQEIKIF